MTANFPARMRPAIDRLGDDPEYEEIRAALSLPVHGAGIARRTFLKGALAAGGAGAMTFGPMAKLADAASPLSSDETILVVIQLGGGNDGLNTVGPFDDPAYAARRPSVAVGAGYHPIGEGGLSFHPSLGRLAARYQAGKVAVVQGVGNPDLDHSHFSSMATWMAGTASPDRSSGWLGRYLDTVPDSEHGLRGVSVDGTIPLHLAGQTAQISAIGSNLPFGANRSLDTEVALFDAIRAYGALPTGLGPLGDRIAAVDRLSIDVARELEALHEISSTGAALTRQLATAAEVLNLDLGVRIVGASLGSFDTHRNQRGDHARLLTDLDTAIETFYEKLDPVWADQVVIMTFSEFGRRATDNGSGTDHGTSAPLLVVGDRVRGGLHGTYPSLTELDGQGDLAVTVDFRSVYASVLGGWLGADADEVLGGSFPVLDLFRSSPPPPPMGPELPTDPRFAPFDDAGEFVIQQFHDFRGVHPAESEILRWGNLVFWGFWSVPVALEQQFVESGLRRFGLDPARVAWMGLGRPPEPEDLRRWTKLAADGRPLSDVAAEVVATQQWRDRYGRLWGDPLIRQVHLDLMRTPPSDEFMARWSPRFARENPKNATAMLTELATTPTGRLLFHNRSIVALVFAAMLRRPPGDDQNRQWGAFLDAGVDLKMLLSHLYDSAEYRARFT